MRPCSFIGGDNRVNERATAFGWCYYYFGWNESVVLLVLLLRALVLVMYLRRITFGGCIFNLTTTICLIINRQFSFIRGDNELEILNKSQLK